MLTRLIDGAHEVELRHTEDQGRTWEAFQLTQNSKMLNFRPVFPRGLDDPDAARRRLRVGRGVELPQLPDRREHADRPVAQAGADPHPTPTPTPTPVPTATPTPTPPPVP